MKGLRSIISLGLGLGLLVYAVPRLEIGGGWSAPTVFSVGWICMALLIIAAHLHDILGVDEKTRREMDNVRLYKLRQMQQWIARGGGKQGSVRGGE